MTWKDVTSYQRGAKKEPNAWECWADWLRITVHRMHGLDGWFLSARYLIDQRSIPYADLEKSKTWALGAVKGRLESALNALRKEAT